MPLSICPEVRRRFTHRVELTRDSGRIATASFSPEAAALGIRRFSTKRSSSRLASLVELYLTGALRVVVRRCYPLSAAAEAHREMELGHGFGKIVLIAMPLTDGEQAYVAAQGLGRLATAQASGRLQNNPVGVHYNALLDAIDIGGHDMAASQKYRNVMRNRQVALVVDDVRSVQPWETRCLEIRGHGEAIEEPVDSATGFDGAIIRVHPERVISWGVDPPNLSLGRRDI